MKYEMLFTCKKTCKIGSGLKRLFYMAESISPAIKIDILKLLFFLLFPASLSYRTKELVCLKQVNTNGISFLISEIMFNIENVVLYILETKWMDVLLT